MTVPVEKHPLTRFLEDFEFYCETVLKVEDRVTGNLVPLRLKPIQRRLARKMIAKWLAGDPVRIIVLKARREGVSTVVQAFFFWVCSTQQNRHAFTVAHDDDTAGYLHGMSERFYEQLPGFIRPQRRQAQRGSNLEFANPSRNPDEQRERAGLNSSMRTVTHKNAGAGKGARLLHLSEVALWPKGEAKKTLDTILQTVPRAAETAVVMESTARDIGNEYHRRWERAWAGIGEYEAIFFPWFDEPTYRVDPPEDFRRTDEEEAIVLEFGVDDAQLFWRRLTIEDECGGDLDIFNREYPATPAEAFLATGRPYFNRRVLLAHQAACEATKPWKRGNLVEAVRDGQKVTVFESDPRRGLLMLWEAPDVEDDYVVFADSSEGKERSDYQAAYVLTRSRLEVVAAWWGRVDRDSFGDELFMLGRLYNTALVAVELTGGWGAVPISVLKRRHYPRIYQRTTFDRRRNKRVVTIGWKTTPESRALMLDALKQSLRQILPDEGRSWVNDPGAIKECLSFNYNEQGKPEAEQGAWDDRVIALAGAVYLWQTEPVRSSDPPAPARPPLSSRTGY